MRSALACLALLLAAPTCTSADRSTIKEKRPSMKPTPVANPYQLADRALAAYRARDLAAWAPLQSKPLPDGATAEQVFRHASALATEDRVQGLFIQRDTGRIAAVIRTVPKSKEALWFEIVRAPGGGFLVEQVLVGQKNPSMELSVEG